MYLLCLCIGETINFFTSKLTDPLTNSTYVRVVLSHDKVKEFYKDNVIFSTKKRIRAREFLTTTNHCSEPQSNEHDKKQEMDFHGHIKNRA